MGKVRFIHLLSFICLFGVLGSFSQAQTIKWQDLKTAQESMQKAKAKNYFIDFYTDWCGYCKWMDKYTFADPAIATMVNNNFIPVKFNAQSTEPLNFAGKSYTTPVMPGYNSTNSWVMEVLHGQLVYPTYVVMDANGNVLHIAQGAMDPQTFKDTFKTYIKNP